jgi:hypothetical protein
MFDWLEILFLTGVALMAIAALWAVGLGLRRRFRRLWAPVAIGLLGLAVTAAPAIYTQAILQVDLGPRQALVNGEKHLTLTGWDGNSYEVLQAHDDAVVLQLANPDVDDHTLRYLAAMSRLRELDLNDTGITDDGLPYLGTLQNLQILRLRNTKITDEGFAAHVLPLPALRNLDLRGTAVTAEMVDRWKSQGSGRRAFR